MVRHYLVALALLLATVLAQAQTPLQLAPEAPRLQSAGHLQRLDDPAQALNAAQAAAATGWYDIPGNVNASYTDAAIWLRLRLDAPQPGQWVLLAGNALLDDMRLYLQAPGGDWRLLGASGENLPRPRWPVDFRSPAIPFDLTQPGTHTLLVRLAARNAINTPLYVWQRLAFDNQTRREGLTFGLYFGFYLLLVGLHVLFWRATRAPLSGLFLAYLGLCVLNEALTLGLVQQLTGLPGAWSDRLLGVGIAIAAATAAHMACGVLRLGQRLPRTERVIRRASTALGVLGTLAILLGRYSTGIVPVQVASLLLIALFTGLALWLWLRGHRPARFFLAAFGIFYASIVVAFPRNLGLLPTNTFTENISAMGTMAHMVLLSLWITGGYLRQRRARERAQIQLEAELAQQQQREGELLQALELERHVRREQRDFVAMVSHEFRTPLAVITTSAQQLARNLQAPPEKTLARSHHIRAAAQRLLALVDDCLADDRMAEPDAPSHLAPCDLHALIAELCQDFSPARIACAHGKGTRHIATDAPLLRIALRNLLANADRHAPEGARVRIDIERHGARLRISVSNPAPAIPSGEQTHLFERHWRGSNARHSPGAGLGLYLVRRIADKLGGSVALVSAGGDAPVCLRLELPV